MKRDQFIYCNDILDRIRRIERYTVGGYDRFLECEMQQDAVIRSFEVIGEAVKRLDKALVEQYPGVMWSDFAGFRDVLIHQYHNVRLHLVWRFAQEDLPILKSTVTRMLEALEG